VHLVVDTGKAPEVAVNLLWCVPGKVGGSEQYLTRQLAGLCGRNEFALHAYVPQGFIAAHSELADVVHMHEMSSTAHNRAARILFENTWLNARTKSAQLVHHGGGTLPLRGNNNTLLTVHDVQYLTYPEYFSAVRLRYLKAMMPRSVKRARAIAVPSAYVRGVLMEQFSLPGEKIHVVRHGVEALVRSEENIARVRNKYGLENVEYFIYPAMTHPHKNHAFLVNLLAGPWKHRSEHLVFIGSAGRAHEELLALIAQLGLAHRVHVVGRVEGTERDAFVAGARALLFPSQYEGFGAPLIEAMSLGVPVVCANTASLPEVAGDAGVVLPLTLEAWSDVPNIIDSTAVDLVQRGHERVKYFSLAESGSDLAATYESMLA
jgi:alpha-1,3-rhamnosyl/mannosyltransferase